MKLNKIEGVLYGQAYMGLHQGHSIYIMDINLIFLWDFWLWEQVGLWILYLLIGLICSCEVAMSNFDMIVFALFYYILKCLIVIS